MNLKQLVEDDQGVHGQTPEWLFKGKPSGTFWDENECHITISEPMRLLMKDPEVSLCFLPLILIFLGGLVRCVFKYGTDNHNDPAFSERRKHLKNVHGATELTKDWPNIGKKRVRSFRKRNGMAHMMLVRSQTIGDNSLLRPLVKSGLRPYTNVRNAAYVCRLRTCFFTPVNLLRAPSPVWPDEGSRP